MKSVASTLLFFLIKIDKPKETINYLDSLIKYLLIYNNYQTFVQKGLFNPSYSKNIDDDHKSVINVVKNVFKNASIKDKKHILHHLYAIRFEIYKRLDRVELVVGKDINDENLSTLKDYVSKKLKLSNNISITYLKDVSINNVFTIKFRNYNMKFSLIDFMLKTIQTNKDFNFWQLIQTS